MVFNLFSKIDWPSWEFNGSGQILLNLIGLGLNEIWASLVRMDWQRMMGLVGTTAQDEAETVESWNFKGWAFNGWFWFRTEPSWNRLVLNNRNWSWTWNCGILKVEIIFLILYNLYKCEHILNYSISR